MKMNVKEVKSVVMNTICIISQLFQFKSVIALERFDVGY